jgi:hypothetical protein
MKKLSVLLALSLILLFGANIASAQVVSNVQTVSLSMLVGESITLGPPSTPSVAYTYNSLAGTASASPASFTIPLSWSLSSGHTGVQVISWVANAGVGGLTAPGGLTIPSTDFYESSSDANGVVSNSLAACSLSNGTSATGYVAGAGCTKMSFGISGTALQYSDVLTIGTAMQGLPNNLAPGGYTATLYFQAVTF